jgi:hypothetical protein
VACLKLLNEEFYVGGDDFLRGQRLGGGGQGSEVAGWVVVAVVRGGMDAHGVVFSVFEWLRCVCSQTRLGPGPRQQGRQVQGEGYLPPERREVRPKAGLHKRSAEDWGYSLRAPGTESLSRFGFLGIAHSA